MARQEQAEAGVAEHPVEIVVAKRLGMAEPVAAVVAEAGTGAAQAVVAGHVHDWRETRLVVPEVGAVAMVTVMVIVETVRARPDREEAAASRGAAQAAEPVAATEPVMVTPAV
jgi:hypothetical protein